MADGKFCRARWCALWPRQAALALSIGIAFLAFVASPAWGNLDDPPPRALHVPYKEVVFSEQHLRNEYDQRCAADLQIMTRFFGSAAAAEQWLDNRVRSYSSSKREKAGRKLVLTTILDHRSSREALFKCLTFLNAARSSATGADLVAIDWAIQLHQGALTSIDGRIIQLLVRMERFTS